MQGLKGKGRRFRPACPDVSPWVRMPLRLALVPLLVLLCQCMPPPEGTSPEDGAPERRPDCSQQVLGIPAAASTPECRGALAAAWTRNNRLRAGGAEAPWLAAAHAVLAQHAASAAAGAQARSGTAAVGARRPGQSTPRRGGLAQNRKTTPRRGPTCIRQTLLLSVLDSRVAGESPPRDDAKANRKRRRLTQARFENRRAR